jgi:DNA replication protein DnaC
MEQIGKILANLSESTQTPPSPVETEATREERREQLRRSLGLSSLTNTFDTFKQIKGTELAYSAFKELASGETKWQMLLCYGKPGNGKSHLCEATSIELYKHGIYCSVMIMSKVMDSLKNTMKDGSLLTHSELMDKYCQMKYLIIDDVGMGGSGSSWEWGQIEDIVVDRYRENRFTILTTNLDTTQLPDRIVDRFRDKSKARLILNNGESYRGKKR